MLHTPITGSANFLDGHRLPLTHNEAQIQFR